MKKLLVAVVVACGFAAFANEWYIDAENGDDTAAGTQGAPRKTLKGAMEIPDLAENDTVWLLPGNYNVGEMPYFDAKVSGMTYASTNRCFITKPGLKIRSTGGKDVTFVTGAKYQDADKFNDAYGGTRCFLIAAEATGVIIEGLTIRTGYAPYKQKTPYWSGGGVLDLSKSCWVIDCTISGGQSARGGGQAYGNALRTEYIDNAASGRASTVINVTMLVNCSIRTPNSVAPVDTESSLPLLTLVNCLITATKSARGLSQDKGFTAYNSIFVGNEKGNGTQKASTFSNCVVGPFIVGAYTNDNVTCVSCVTNATVDDVAWADTTSPYDWRIASTSVARGVGDTAILATIQAQLPEGYSVYTDLYGTPIPKEGKIAAGPVQPVNWYVDAESGNDDDHGGKTLADAFKTIRKATSVAYDGDTIRVAPGVYGEAEGSELEESAQTRVVVPEGVRLQGEGERYAAVIRGAAASEGDEHGYGLGTDAVRCIYLNKNATLANFTLTEGRTLATSKGHGSAVYAADNTATVVDCLVTNNYCYEGTLYNGRYVRCRVIDNTSSHRSVMGRNGIYYGCFFDYCKGDYQNTSERMLCNATSIDFCTIGTHNTGNDGRTTPQILAPSTSVDTQPLIPIRNSVLMAGGVWAASKFYATNCVFTVKYDAFAATNNCLIMTAAEMKLSDDGVPSADSPVNNWGNVDFAPDCVNETDINGVPRVLNGGVDAGAFEHDWRVEYKEDLGPRATSVTFASPAVVKTEDHTVRISSGSLVGTLKLGGAVRFDFTVKNGKLDVYQGTEHKTVTATEETQASVELWPSEADDAFRLVFTPSAADGYAEVARLKKGANGIIFMVR